MCDALSVKNAKREGYGSPCPNEVLFLVDALDRAREKVDWHCMLYERGLLLGLGSDRQVCLRGFFPQTTTTNRLLDQSI